VTRLSVMAERYFGQDGEGQPPKRKTTASQFSSFELVLEER
jgi:hypothetical protein